MATREIKTTIEIDGEQKFKQALSSATREMRVMESELKAVSAAYNANGNQAEYFAARQKNLRGQIAQQKEIIEALERAVKDAAKTYGEGTSQVDGYAIRLNNARTRMSKLQKELDATDREIEELGRDSVRAGRQLEEGIAEGAENAENSVRSMMNAMQSDIASIRTSSAVSAVQSLWDMATGAYSAVEGFVSGTVDYRRQLSFLAQNAQTTGFDFSVLEEELIRVQGLTGDASSAIEGLSNLLAAGVDERQLTKAIENLAGAVISFPETLKFESLADGLQETIATGSATGQFAELLERLGIDVGAFNKALEESPTKAGDLEIALAYLSEHGLANVYKQWQKNNGAMVEAMATQAELEQELAKFGGTLEEYIVTPVKSLLVDALQWVNETLEVAKKEGAKAALDKTKEDFVTAGMQGTEDRTQEEKAAAEAFLKGEAGNAEFMTLLKARWNEWFGPKEKGENLDLPGANTPEKSKEEAKAAGEEAAAAYLEGWESVVINPDEAVEAMVLGPNGENINPVGMRDDLVKLLEELKTVTTQEEPELEAAGENAGEALEIGFEAGISGASSAAYRNGADAARNFGAGILSQLSYVAYAASQAAAAAAAAAAAGINSRRNGSGVGSTQKSAGENFSATLSIDGQTFGRIVAPYVSANMAVQEG